MKNNYNIYYPIKKKYDSLKIMYLVFILIVSVGPVGLYGSNSFIFFRLILSYVFLLIFNFHLNKKYITVLYIWLLFILFCYLFTNNFKLTSISHYFTLFTEAYVLILLLKEKLLYYYVNAMVKLSIISLIGWIMIILALNVLKLILSPIAIHGISSLENYYVIFFNVHHTVFWVDGLPRNAGFAWEPGPFSILIVLAIYFNNEIKYQKFFSKNNIILYSSLITTFSTTGMGAFFGYLLMRYYNKVRNPKYFLFLILVLCIMIYSFLNFDFLGQKVNDSATENNYIKERINGQEVLSGRRIGGFNIVWQDFKNNPLIGKGFVDTNTYKYYGKLKSVYLNSFYTILSNMGIIGLFFWLWLLSSSSRRFKIMSNKRNNVDFLLIITISSFGFNIHLWSIVLSFLFFGYYYNSLVDGEKHVRE